MTAHRILDPKEIIRIYSPNRSKLGPRRRRLIGIHATQGHERDGSAQGVARNWFALPSTKASADFITGPDAIVQCVPDDCFSWHAGKANPYSFGVEITGKSEQSGPPKDSPLAIVGEWLDEQSQAALRNAARLVAWLCVRESIEVALLTDEQLKALHAGDESISGICGHVDISRAIGGNHWDPGPSFPWSQFLLGVKGYYDLTLAAQGGAE